MPLPGDPITWSLWDERDEVKDAAEARPACLRDTIGDRFSAAETY
jgi:hypothetical protein